jgi:deoxyribodipyrimidine photo-lyase
MVNKSADIVVVWFKRDLRVNDHAALCSAVATGLPVVPLYVIEPDYWRQPDTSARQFDFVRESLVELRQDLARLGQPLIVRTGDVVSVFSRLNRKHRIAAVFAHEETGNGWTFARDKKVAAFARSLGIDFYEVPQNGVIRRIASRDGWAARWNKTMAAPQIAPPVLRPLAAAGFDLDPGPVPTAQDLGLACDICPGRQPGGRRAGLAQLGLFLSVTGLAYRRAMASPGAGALHCSRLSPHLAVGTVSAREVTQAALARMDGLEPDAAPQAAQWRAAMVSFLSRLHWRDHFTQKLEDQPALEFQALHPHLREAHERCADHQAAAFLAWQTGTTGVPFVDACMRCLNQTGWLNFRMRAMLMSFASHLLDLPWRQTGLHLARQFVDYEPGIHWSQVQMQSGLTGINTIRIYNPVKQGLEHDAGGGFIRLWVPELQHCANAFLHNPWMDATLIDARPAHYPQPLIHVATAMRAARERLHAPRQGTAFHRAADAIQTKHGSRKAGLPPTTRPKRSPKRNPKPAAAHTAPRQPGLFD